MRPRIRALVIVPIVAISSSCGDTVDKLQQLIVEQVEDQAPVPSDPTPAATGGPELPEEEQMQIKLNLYVNCLNASEKRIQDSWQRYLGTVGERGAPKRKRTSPHIYAIDGELTDCVRAVQEGPNLNPSLPELERAQAQYTEAAQEFATHTRELDSYYREQAYGDDDWAKGKRIAPEIKAAFERWELADKELSLRLDAKKDAADLQMLAIVEQRTGRDIQYFTRSYLIRAKNFMRCVDTHTAAPNEDKCEQPFGEIEQAQTDFRSYYEANKADANKVFWMSKFEASVTDFYEESKKFARVVAERKVKPQHIQTVIDEYNDLVNDSNNLNFNFPG